MDYFDLFSGLTAKKSYDETNALSLAIACHLAYQKEGEVITAVIPWDYQVREVISITKAHDIDTQCFIMENQDHVVIVFRGSDSKSDWFANFQAVQDPGPFESTGAHEGFQDALFPAVIAITRCLQNINMTKKKLWVTGHSLGGALCSLYSGMLIENGFDVYGIYTFASPRPGSPKFADQLNEKVTGPHFRVVNDQDIVPHVPPEPFFSHPGKRVILKRKHKERTKASWFKQRVDALKNFVEMTGHAFDVGDNHRLVGDNESYIPRLVRDAKRKKN